MIMMLLLCVSEVHGELFSGTSYELRKGEAGSFGDRKPVKLGRSQLSKICLQAPWTRILSKIASSRPVYGHDAATLCCF